MAEECGALSDSQFWSRLAAGGLVPVHNAATEYAACAELDVSVRPYPLCDNIVDHMAMHVC